MVYLHNTEGTREDKIQTISQWVASLEVVVVFMSGILLLTAFHTLFIVSRVIHTKLVMISILKAEHNRIQK